MVTYIVWKDTMKVKGDQKPFGHPHSLKCHLLCLAEERNAFRLGTALG